MTLNALSHGEGGPTDLDFRDRLSSMQGLLVLSMVMTERTDEAQIVELATTALGSLGRARVCGAYVDDKGWQHAAGPCDDDAVRADIESQFAVLSTAGGALAILHEGWGWAFPLRSIAGHFGYLVVAADDEPPSDEQFLLRVLAQQTGIALANARLHGRERVISRELRAANTALEASVAALERSTAIHDRLTRTALAGEGHDGIAQAVHDLTGLAVAVEDAHGNLRAWAGPDQPDPYPKEPPRERQALLAQARDQGQPLRSGDRVIALAAAGEGVVEVLALVDPDHTVGPHERVALEHGATVLAIELSRLRSIAEAQLRLGGDLVHHLLAGTNDEDGLVSHAHVLGYDLLRPHRVVLVDAGAAAPAGEAFLHAVRRAARDAEIGTLVATRRDQVVVLADGDRGWEELRKAVIRESGGGHCRVGVGGIADRPVDLPRSLHEATLAVRMEDAARGSDHVAVYDELGVYRLLAAVEDTDTIETFVTEWLGPLRAYDERRRSDLVLTLTRYLECGRSLEATANDLSIHRSTLKYRLQRIKEISGHDLGDPDIGFTLQLATRAWQTLTAMRGSGD